MDTSVNCKAKIHKTEKKYKTTELKKKLKNALFLFT